MLNNQKIASDRERETQLVEKFRSKAWRLTHLYSIIDKNKNKVIYTPNVFQQQILGDPGPRKLFLKSRQLGISTHCLIEELDYTITNKNVTSCIVAHEQDAIEKLFRIVTRAYDSLDPVFKPRLDRGGGSKYEMFFPKLNSRIYCDLESRGDTINYLHISEAAFIKDPDRMIATLQAVPLTTGRVTIESTPNGIGNMFYDYWNDPSSPYKKYFFPWFLHEEYKIIDDLEIQYSEQELKLISQVRKSYNSDLTQSQIKFRRAKQIECKSSLGKAAFVAEYPEDDQSCFLASGSAAFDLFKVKDQELQKKDPIEVLDDITLFCKYKNNNKYVIGVDCSEGVGLDYSVASVFCVRTKEQVASLRCQKKPSLFADRIYGLAKMYYSKEDGYPLIAVERNNHGHAVLLSLDDIHHYPNLFRYKDDRLGWLTDKITRPLMLDLFIDGVENRTLILNDPITIKECLTLIDNNGKIEAAPKKHDDCVIACSIALQMILEYDTLDVYTNISDRILV